VGTAHTAAIGTSVFTGVTGTLAFTTAIGTSAFTGVTGTLAFTAAIGMSAIMDTVATAATVITPAGGDSRLRAKNKS